MSAPIAIPPGVRARVLWRSLFLQASWNPQGMQNLGLAYALYPALRHLYREPPELKRAVARHLAFFNTHPYVAAALLGGILHHEARIAAGLEPEERVVAFKAALMGPLAALGDGFFWLSLRPFVGAFCAACVPLLGVGAVPLFLGMYNGVHLTFRIRMFQTGLSRGDRLIETVAKANLPTRGARLRVVTAMYGRAMNKARAISHSATSAAPMVPSMNVSPKSKNPGTCSGVIVLLQLAGRRVA